MTSKALLSALGEIRKAGARHGANDRTLLNKAHDAVAELTRGAHCAGMEKAAPALLVKAGARHSKKDLEAIKAVHDGLVGLGAKCEASKDGMPHGTD